MAKSSDYKLEKIHSTLGRKEPKFRSLRWKISLGSSLILIAVVTLFCFVSYLSLMVNFENQHNTDNRRYERELDNLIKNTSQNLHRLAEIIPFLDGMKKALLTNDGESISEIFDRHWALLQFHNGVEFAHFYNPSNQLNAAWDNLELTVNDENLLLSWVNDVNRSELPINPLLCRESCIQFIVAPLLVEGKKAGVVILGISLADVFLAFKRIFGADIGLLVKNQDDLPLQDTSEALQWDFQITALTNRERNYQLLKKVSRQYPDLEKLKEGAQIRWSDHFQQIKLFYLDSVEPDNAHLIVITDVTEIVNNIHDSIWKIAFIGVLGLIISEVLLFLIFTRLLARLKDVAYALPLLASGQFENFRLSLASTDRVYRFSDEIDTLSHAAVTLSLQLEKLEHKVSTRTKMLIEQRDELSKERDFVKNLLDTAQAIVLTQNSEGRIISLNAYGEMLTRYTERELRGKSFLSILIPEYESLDALARFKEIHTGQKMQLRHEAITHCKDGSTRHVAWLHSHLSWHSEEDPSILSVGLDVTEYKRVEGHLAWLADHDPLTNMFNRRRFSEELEQVLSRAERYHHPGALLFFDLDRFKYVNDTSGHQAGDTLLKIVASMLMQTIRADDITGRLGGDEFAIILPEINADGAIEVAKKVLNQWEPGQALVTHRPFRAPHHTASDAGLLGGNINPTPGEISLAHHGVLFLDELPEFKRSVLETMRQPLEEGRVTISRAAGTMTFPSQFMLLAAMNPTPDGKMPGESRCSPREIQSYLNRISGPLLDRIDLHVEVPAVKFRDIASARPGESSAQIRERVVAARERQQRRLADRPRVTCNARMGTRELKQFCALDEATGELLKVAMAEYNLSARAYDRILKVARTIADLAGLESITADHVSEAIQYRTLDRQLWG